MELNLLIDGLLMFIGLVVLLTFHEFGHAWTALKCGDDTARLQGRVSLNPLVHMDLWGTVIIPLAMIFLSASGSALGGFLVGWAKPVPVNVYNLRRRELDDILVTLAGPLMNLLLALVLVFMAKGGLLLGSKTVATFGLSMAHLSILLCFFNLLPIPPLDGSRVMRVVIGMSYDTFFRIAQYGIFILILVLQIPAVRQGLHLVTEVTFTLMARLAGFGT